MFVYITQHTLLGFQKNTGYSVMAHKPDVLWVSEIDPQRAFVKAFNTVMAEAERDGKDVTVTLNGFSDRLTIREVGK